jgi:hypothetical protein
MVGLQDHQGSQNRQRGKIGATIYGSGRREDEYAAFVRYCFSDPMDAAIFRSRFERKVTRLKLAG